MTQQVGTTNDVFYRDRQGRVYGSWWATDWLRQWLSSAELWTLLESLSDDRLSRFGAAVQAAVIAKAGPWGPWRSPEGVEG